MLAVDVGRGSAADRARGLAGDDRRACFGPIRTKRSGGGTRSSSARRRSAARICSIENASPLPVHGPQVASISRRTGSARRSCWPSAPAHLAEVGPGGEMGDLDGGIEGGVEAGVHLVAAAEEQNGPGRSIRAPQRQRWPRRKSRRGRRIGLTRARGRWYRAHEARQSLSGPGPCRGDAGPPLLLWPLWAGSRIMSYRPRPVEPARRDSPRSGRRRCSP